MQQLRKFATVVININSVHAEVRLTVILELLNEKTITLLYGMFDNENFRAENKIFAKFEILQSRFNWFRPRKFLIDKNGWFPL